jgi:hypothetical protein
MADNIYDTTQEETASQFTAIGDVDTTTDADATTTDVGTTTTQEGTQGILDLTSDLYDVETTTPAYDAYVPPDVSEYAPEPGETYMTPETSVSEQFSRLIAEDSPLIQTARRKAREQAQAKGILSTTTAIGMADEAAYATAYKQAEKEADIAAKFKGQEQLAATELMKIEAGGIVSGALTAYEAAVTQANQNVNNLFTAQMKAADTRSQIMLADVQAKWNEDTQLKIAEFQNVFNEKLKNKEIEANKYNTAMNSASYIMQNTQTAITNLMNNPDVMSQKPSQVSKLFNNVIDQSIASIEFITSTVDLDPEQFKVILNSYRTQARYRG